MRLFVSEHAIQLAKQRYGIANVDWKLIHRDVRDAILNGRAGKEHPNGSGYVCVGNSVFAWTPNRGRIYVVEGVSSKAGPFLRVLTSLPGYWDGGEHMGSARREAA